MSHAIKMMLGCLVPILLLFFLPMIGAGEGITMFIAITLMFGCHLLMLGGHGGEHHDK